MFTGLVETCGIIEQIEGKKGILKAKISAPLFNDLKLGDSVAVDGACLTVTELCSPCFCVEMVPETLKLTTFAQLKPGERVNLERALKVGDRLGGHFVQGHVDGMATLERIDQTGDESYELTFKAPPSLTRYLVFKGSVALNGISLTVKSVQEELFSVAIIPHTWHATNLCEKKVGDRFHIETDMLAKYLEKMRPSIGNPSELLTQ